MGLLDNLANLSPEQTQGLLAFASSALQAGGSGRPVSTLGALGGGIQAFQQSMDAQKKLKMDQEQAAQIAQLTGLKIKDAESDLANQQALRDRAEQLRQFYIKQGGGGSQSGGLQNPAGMGGNLAPTVGNSARMQLIAPESNQSSNQNTGIYQQRLAQAQALRNAGYGPEADAAEAAALKFQPKVKGWEKVQQAGKVMYAPFFEDGTSGAPVPLEVAEKLEKINTGGSTELANPYTGATVRSMQNTQDPNSIASNAVAMRGQNMTDARARETNDISRGIRADTQQQKVRDENLTKQGQIASFDTMLDSLDRLDKSPGLPRSVGLYSKTPTIPGSDSANFQAELETFKSQAFLPQVAQLKGMGALSDAEGKKLSAAVGALDPSMSEKAFRESIKRITDTMNTARERVVNSSRESVRQGSAQPQPARKSVMRGQVIDGYRFKGGDPSQQSNWEKQ